jgi:hypothetical protein
VLVIFLTKEIEMHRLQSRTYVGQPGETVSVGTTVDGGGQVRITVGGQPVLNGQFQLPSSPGATVRMQIALAGPQGASCVVPIAVVDGDKDTDFLLCSVFNPAPVHFYDFAVAGAAAVAALAGAKNVPVAGGPAGVAAAAPAAAPATAARKTARPRASKPPKRGK